MTDCRVVMTHSGYLPRQSHAHQRFELRQALPTVTRGEGVVECAFDRYEPVAGPGPAGPRSDGNPLKRDEYLPRVTGVRRVPAGR